MGDDELAALLIQTFLPDTPRQIESLRRSIETGDQQAVGFLAHAIRGAALSAGAGRLTQIAQHIEDSAAIRVIESFHGSAYELEAAFLECKREMETFLEQPRSEACFG